MKSLTFALASLDRIEQILIENGGHLTPEIEQELLFKEIQAADVVDQEYIKLERIDHVIEFYAKKAEYFSKIASSLSKYKEYRREQIKQYLIESGKEQLTGDEYVFKLSGAAPRVKIVDESLIDKAYVRIKTEIDKKAISEDLKKGIPVEGAILEENKSLRMAVVKGVK